MGLLTNKYLINFKNNENFESTLIDALNSSSEEFLVDKSFPIFPNRFVIHTQASRPPTYKIRNEEYRNHFIRLGKKYIDRC